MTNRIHIVGASGSGTTTLGKAIAHRLRCPHFDTDDYYWLPSNPPFEKVRDRSERQTLLMKDLTDNPDWVLSGSLCGWGNFAIPLFNWVIFLWIPANIRLARLKAREQARYGKEAIMPGGTLHHKYKVFLKWAAAYDEGDLTLRSKKLHEQWLATLPCPVLRLEDNDSVEEATTKVINALGV